MTDVYVVCNTLNMPKEYIFPKDFTWGTALSAHQTEGNNKNTDWWKYETHKKLNQKYPLEPSGIAADSYHRYEEDFKLARELQNNAIRLSIEWARLQPTKEDFDFKEFQHYKTVIKNAKENGLAVFVTLHHFTNPLWFAELGGWSNSKAPEMFEKYAKVCAEELGDIVDVFLTINEPQVLVAQGYIKGAWPPNKRNTLEAFIVQQNIIEAHKRAYKVIKAEGNTPVGIVKNIVWYETGNSKWNLLDTIATKIMFYVNSHFFLSQIKNELDLIGLNYYFTTKIQSLKLHNDDDIQNDLGWWVHPAGLEQVLLALKKYNLPIYITENGCADQLDRIRPNFIKTMLIAAHNAMTKGVNLKGYFHWSLIDNYEWNEGYKAKFGLIYIDRQLDLKRVPRNSYYYYRDISASGKVIDEATN